MTHSIYFLIYDMIYASLGLGKSRSSRGARRRDGGGAMTMIGWDGTMVHHGYIMLYMVMYMVMYMVKSCGY